MKILITGFDPFGGQMINPSYEAVRSLPDHIGVAEIIKAEIPTVFGKGAEVLSACIAQHRPDAVICVGQAGGRSAISLERVAINVQDANIPDNVGLCPTDVPIVPDGPAAYFSTLPIKEILSALVSKGIPAQISNSAGTFVCNDLLYHLLHQIQQENLPTLGGFIHVPYLPEQAQALSGPTPSMELSRIGLAIETAVQVIIDNLTK